MISPRRSYRNTNHMSSIQDPRGLRTAMLGKTGCAPQTLIFLSFLNTHNRGKSRRSDCVRLRRHPLIMVMKPSDFGNRDHLPVSWRLDRPRLWTVHRQRQMDSPGMVIGKVAGQDALQMLLMHKNLLIQTYHNSIGYLVIAWTLACAIA